MDDRPPAAAEAPSSSLKLTSFALTAFINGKNVASTFAKTDSQTVWGRDDRSDQLWTEQREKKRRRLMGSEEELEAVQRARTEEEDQLEKVSLDVLVSAPAGSVRSAPAKVVEAVPVAAADDDELLEDGSDALAVDPMTRTIIIHPGSRWLRIGRASDAFPTTVPNVIARRIPHFAPSSSTKGKEREPASGLPVVTPSVPAVLSQDTPSSSTSVAATALVEPDVGPNGVEDHEMDEDEAEPIVKQDLDPVTAKINSLRADLRARMRLYKLRGTMNGNEQALAFNASVRPEKLAEYNDADEIEWTDLSDKAEYYIGAKASRIPDIAESGYVLRYPYDRGSFNTTGYLSPQELLCDIERIWLGTLEEELGIAKSVLKDYSAILIIPDIYDQMYIREMAGVILNNLGFKQMCIQQESICASFGAGLATACVIDIGAKKTSISCIEDGLILPESRMVLDFGGDDITEFLFTLLMRTNFPYRDADLSRWQDFLMMDKLKENMIVLSEADVGVHTFDFCARKPGAPTLKYELRAYDDVVLAPYALFSPRVIEFDRKTPVQQHLWSKKHHDGIDIGGNAVTRAMRASTQHIWAPPPAPAAPAPVSAVIESPPAPSVSTEAIDTPTEAISSLAVIEEAPIELAPPSAPVAAAPVAAAAAVVANFKAPNVDIRREAGKIPLHIAVVQSILAAGLEDRMRRICNSVLIVGGTANVHNIGFAIESRAAPIIEAAHPALTNAFTIVPSPQDIDPRILAWKGISVLCKLDVASETWVRREDWEMLGLRAVRERGVFFA